MCVKHSRKGERISHKQQQPHTHKQGQRISPLENNTILKHLKETFKHVKENYSKLISKVPLKPGYLLRLDSTVEDGLIEPQPELEESSRVPRASRTLKRSMNIPRKLFSCSSFTCCSSVIIRRLLFRMIYCIKL